MVSQPTSFEIHAIVEEIGLTPVELLSQNCSGISKTKIKQALTYGAVWLTRLGRTTRIRKAKRILQIGDELHFYYSEAILFSEIPSAKLISDEGEYSVWNKPSGMFSQGTKWGDHSSIARWVELFGLARCQLPLRPTYLVHRLDRATSGLILVAHSKKATVLLTRLFEQRKIDKRYVALVDGRFPLHSVKQIQTQIDNKESKSIVIASKFDEVNNHSSLLVKLETGRKHQIRRHLSGIGFPVVGDRLYGNIKLENKSTSDIQLCSSYLAFECPFTKTFRNYELADKMQKCGNIIDHS